MRQFLQKTYMIVLLSMWILGISQTSADAYVLHGLHILELMVEKVGNPTGLTVNQTLSLYPPSDGSTAESPVNPVKYTETLYYYFPDKFRSEIKSEEMQHIHMVSSGESVTIRDQKIVSTQETEFHLYKDLLLYRSRVLLGNQLLRKGIDVSVSSLGRFEGEVAYVIGAKYPDESVSQLWIGKDSFLPIRLLIAPSQSPDAMDIPEMFEIRYQSWKKLKDSWYPMRIELYSSNRLVRLIQVLKVTFNSVFPDNFFDILQLKAMYPALVADKPEPMVNDDLNEIKKTIEDFNRLFE